MKRSMICSTVISPRFGCAPRRVHASGGRERAALLTSAREERTRSRSAAGSV